MIDLPTDAKRVGIIFEGEDSSYGLAFVVCCGLDLNNDQLEIFTCTGAMTSSELNLPTPGEDPKELRAQVINRNVRLAEQNKTHNTEEVEDRFRPFLVENVNEIEQELRSRGKQQVKKFLQDRIRRDVFFSNKLQLSSFFVDYDDLVLEDDGESAEESKPDGEQVNAKSDDVRVLNISPELSAVKGREVRELVPGTEVLVRLEGEDAKLMGSGSDPEEMDPFPAEVLYFDESSGGDDGTLRVKIQEGIHGECEVPGGSRIEKRKFPETEDSYEENLQFMAWLVTGMLGLLIVLSFLIFL